MRPVSRVLLPTFAFCSLLLVLHLAGLLDTFPPANAAAPEGTLKDQLPRRPHQEPKQAVKSFETQRGFTMDLVAHEPLIADPVAVAYDENGRMFAVEMRGYPFPEKMDDRPIGRLRMLEDTNGDGTFDESHVLVDDLSWPTAVICWKGGAFVAAAPDIWYFKDTDGDHRADVRKKLFTGFGRGNVQGLVNSLHWGLDQKIYGATANNGGEIVPADQPNAKPISVRGRDFRFDPETLTFEAISGTSQFGTTFDDWGNRFTCNNSVDAQQIVLPSRYLARNPYLPAPPLVVTIAKEGVSSPIYRISASEPYRVIRTKRRESDGNKYGAAALRDDVFSGASGLTVYRGAAYPEEFRGNIFVGEPCANLVHRKIVTANGVTFLATRAEEKTEFTRSPDNWFRPVNFANAPDGTLHVIDMYRETIEHPLSIPDDLKPYLDLESGRDRGRIYRLSPPGFKPPKPPTLASATTQQLVAELANPNGWTRETAQRLLHERGDKSAVAGLQKLAAECSLPQGRLHALWTLHGFNALTEQDLLTALADKAAPVREHAVRLSESRLAKSKKLLEKVAALAADPVIRVRLQVAFSLGEVADPAASKGLAAIARHDAGDQWVRVAVLSSAVASADRLLIELLADRKFATSGPGIDMLRQLALVVGGRNRSEEVTRVLSALDTSPNAAASVTLQRAIVIGLGDGLARSRANLSRFVTNPVSSVAKMLGALLEQAEKTAQDAKASVAQREQAIQLLSYGSFNDVQATLSSMLDSRQPQETQLAAVRALAGFQDAKVPSLLLEPWRSYTPAVRGEVTETLLGRKDWVTPFLDAVEAKTVLASQISPTRKDLLLKHPDSSIRSKAQGLFGEDAPSPRKEVISAYQPALALSGEAARGQKVFERECMTCHKIGAKGHEVGPNLATVKNRTPDSLMTQILDPNREVLPNYTEYIAVIDDGRVVTGLIASETPTSISLKRAQNALDTILRQNIEEMNSTGKSLMPEGLEKKISQQEMADLLTFLLNIK